MKSIQWKRREVWKVQDKFISWIDPYVYRFHATTHLIKAGRQNKIIIISMNRSTYSILTVTSLILSIFHFHCFLFDSIYNLVYFPPNNPSKSSGFCWIFAWKSRIIAQITQNEFILPKKKLITNIISLNLPRCLI